MNTHEDTLYLTAHEHTKHTRTHSVPDGHLNDLKARPVDLLDQAQDRRQHVRVL